jgi:hypothetical protein
LVIIQVGSAEKAILEVDLHQPLMKNFCLFLFLLVGFVRLLPAQTDVAAVPASSINEVVATANRFLGLLPEDLRSRALYPFTSEERFDWHFVPRNRNGLPLKSMNESQRRAALAVLRMGLSEQGFSKAQAIMDLENVLREIENRPPNDTRRDPENYAFTIFGTPSEQQPWGWRIDGHHLSLHFSFISRKLISFTPGFMGSNPGIVPSGAQKGKQILKQESDIAYALLKSFTPDQLKKVIIATESPYEIVTGNSRKASLEKMEGLPVSKMNASQKKRFTELLNVYIGRYHKTLAQYQMNKLEKEGLEKLHFAWAGSTDRSAGHYYRIHGPVLLIEFDNTQNEANHVHTVVRDLQNDFGEDFLNEHYQKTSHRKPGN